MDLRLFETTAGALVGTALVTAIFYVVTITIVRLAGKRAIAKVYAVDFAVSVAMGSILAAVMLQRDVSVWRGFVALGTLVGMQMLTTRLVTSSPAFAKLATGEPRLLVYRGRLLEGAMKDESIGREVVEYAARKGGLTDVTRAFAIVLETDGSLSLLDDPEGPTGAAFDDLLTSARHRDPEAMAAA